MPDTFRRRDIKLNYNVRHYGFGENSTRADL